ncbi:MAG: universal stress protein [Candidatus Kapaibacteriota bacterium]|jgi:nucleotide-binding universal stress UspA family protein
MRYKNILVPVDFSDGSNLALSHAVDYAKTMGSTIHLLHIIQPISYPIGMEIAHYNFSDVEKEMIETSKRNLTDLTNLNENSGVKFEVAVNIGSSSSTSIIDFCKSENIDLVCIATHGSSGLEHFLFGSTTEKVLRKANCPVLVVRMQH